MPRTLTSEERLDRSLVGAAAVAFLAAMLLMLDERFLFRVGQRSASNLVAVGQVVRETKEVRRKVEGDLDFQNIAGREVVFEGDSIFVGEGSSAEIKIGANTTLTLDPGSLVVLHQEPSGKPRISVRRGKVRARVERGQAVILDIGGKTQEFTSNPIEATATLQATADPAVGTPQLSVISGAATMVTEGKTEQLAVAPSPPTPVAPLGGQLLRFAAGASPGEVRLVYQSRPETAVEIQVASRRDFDPSVILATAERSPAEDSFEFSPQREGRYYWRIRSLSQKTGMRSEWTAPSAFEVRPALPTLARAVAAPASPLSPVLEFPSRRFVLKEAQDSIRFRWQKIPRAALYELTLMQRRPEGGYEVRTYRTPSNEHAVTLDREGPLTWRVKAVSDGGRAPAWASAESEARVDILRPLLDRRRPALMALSSMAAPYRYSISSAFHGALGSAASVAFTSRLSAEYWVSERWGFSGFGEVAQFTIASNPFSRMGFHFDVKTQFTVGGDQSWQLIPSAGNDLRQYFEATPTQATQFFTWGPTLSLMARKTFTERFRLELSASAFLPLVPFGLSRSASLTMDQAFRNLTFGAQLQYWPSQKIGLGLGGLFDLRSISYQVPLMVGTEQVTSDASAVYFNLVYRFERAPGT